MKEKSRVSPPDVTPPASDKCWGMPTQHLQIINADSFLSTVCVLKEYAFKV